jgi:uncharacterized Zn finger protein (UPF0148 family)
MVETDDRFYECPKCGWVLTFKLVKDRYTSLCPYCKDRLEIDKNEFERDDLEIYFEPDRGII